MNERTPGRIMIYQSWKVDKIIQVSYPLIYMTSLTVSRGFMLFIWVIINNPVICPPVRASLWIALRGLLGEWHAHRTATPRLSLLLDFFLDSTGAFTPYRNLSSDDSRRHNGTITHTKRKSGTILVNFSNYVLSFSFGFLCMHYPLMAHVIQCTFTEN